MRKFLCLCLGLLLFAVLAVPVEAHPRNAGLARLRGLRGGFSGQFGQFGQFSRFAFGQRSFGVQQQLLLQQPQMLLLQQQPLILAQQPFAFSEIDLLTQQLGILPFNQFGQFAQRGFRGRGVRPPIHHKGAQRLRR